MARSTGAASVAGAAIDEAMDVRDTVSAVGGSVIGRCCALSCMRRSISASSEREVAYERACSNCSAAIAYSSHCSRRPSSMRSRQAKPRANA